MYVNKNLPLVLHWHVVNVDLWKFDTFRLTLTVFSLILETENESDWMYLKVSLNSILLGLPNQQQQNSNL